MNGGKMMNYRRKKGRVHINLYNIVSICSGFYIGYNEGKGIDVSPTIEYLTKFGPTAFACAVTPLTMNLSDRLLRWTKKRMLEDLESGRLEVRYGKHYIRYADMDVSEKKKIYDKVMANGRDLESRMKDRRYLRPTIVAGTKAAVYTAIGYAIGRIYGGID